MPVAVVTDSTAHLPEGFAARHAVHVVPLHVLIDDVAGLDGVDIGPAELAKAFGERRTVTTSRLVPGELAERYRALLADGADAIVSVHLSRELSGTWESARVAAEEVGAGPGPGGRLADHRDGPRFRGACGGAERPRPGRPVPTSRPPRWALPSGRPRSSCPKPSNTSAAAAGSARRPRCWVRRSP